MNTWFDRLRRMHQDAFAKGQAMVAHHKAAADFAASQNVTQEAVKAARETIDLANELAADNDPHKRELADAIKEWAVGGVKEVVRGQLPTVEDGRALEDHPFSGPTETSAGGLSESPKAKPLPAPPSSPPPAKRRPGRPRKSPQG